MFTSEIHSLVIWKWLTSRPNISEIELILDRLVSTKRLCQILLQSKNRCFKIIFAPRGIGLNDRSGLKWKTCSAVSLSILNVISMCATRILSAIVFLESRRAKCTVTVGIDVRCRPMQPLNFSQLQDTYWNRTFMNNHERYPKCLSLISASRKKTSKLTLHHIWFIRYRLVLMIDHVINPSE